MEAARDQTNRDADVVVIGGGVVGAIAAACNGQGFQLAPESGRRGAALGLEPAEVGAP